MNDHPDSHHDHEHGSELSEAALRVRALETILTEKGYIDPAALDVIIETYETKIGPRNGALVVARAWRGRVIGDDVPVQSNTRGFVAFANTGPGTRAAQVFVNLGDNAAQNDWEPGFAPFGRVVEGMEVVDRLYSGYGEGSGGGMRAGGQDPMFEQGNAWLDARFPLLDRLVRVALR